MKTRLISTRASFLKTMLPAIACASLMGCASVGDIVPQIPTFGSANSTPVVGGDIAQANALLAAGRKREAAEAYFFASQNYLSPERDRLILQAAELSSAFKDTNLTQRYLAPLNFNQLTEENKIRFRLTQAQLALNDRNFREALRILPQRVNGIPAALGSKVLAMRMASAQGSGDKLALVQELVLQETTLTQAHQVSLNHDRIWNHAKQISAFQLEQAKNSISHPTLKNWLSLAQLSRVAGSGTNSKRKTLRSDLGRWLQQNANHPGKNKALALLNAIPKTTITPLATEVKRPLVIKSTVKQNVRPVPRPPVINRPVVKPRIVKPQIVKPRIVRPQIVPPKVIKPPVVKPPVIKVDPDVRSLYERAKQSIK